MNAKLESCLNSCAKKCTEMNSSFLELHYLIVDINNRGFSIVPLQGVSFYSWETFASIVKKYGLTSYFRLFTREDESVCVSMRVIFS